MVLLRRLFLGFCCLLFVAAIVVAALFFISTRDEYRQMRRVEEESRQTLAAAEARLAEQRRVLERLRSDPAYVEQVIRRKLGFARPEELVFRFEE